MAIRGPADSEVYAYLARLERGELDRAAPSGIAAGSLGYGAGGPVWLDAFKTKRPPSPFELADAYKSVAYACIQLNANGVARVPLKLYVRTGTRDRRPRRACRPVPLREERRLRRLPYLARSLGPDDQVDEIAEHDFLAALDDPNPYFDGPLFLAYAAISLDVIGQFFFVPERATPAQSSRVWWPLQSQYVFPVKGQGTEVLASYRYFGDTFRPDQVVRLRRLSIRDPYLSGYSPLHACFEQVGLSDYYTAVVESILKSGARPELVIGPDDPAMPWGDAEAERLEEDIANRFSRGGAGKVWVLRRPYKLETMSYPPADLSGLEVSKWERLLVANCFDVPISLLQAEDTNRAVASEGTHQHQYYAVEPRCRLIAGGLTKYLARPINDRMFFAFDSAVDRDIERDARVFDMRLKNGSTTINEYRNFEAEDPVPWGDEPWLASSLVQPSTAEEQRQQEQASAMAQAKALALAKTTGELPDDDGDDDDGQAGTEDAEAEAEAEAKERAALTGRMFGALATIERHLDRLGAGGRAGPGGGGGGPGHAAPLAPADRSDGGSHGPPRGQHVPPSAGESDPSRAGGLVPEAGVPDPGDGAGDRGEPA